MESERNSLSEKEGERGIREMEAQVEGKCCRLIFLRMIISIIFCLTLLTSQHTVSFFFLQNLNRSLHSLSSKCFFPFCIRFLFPLPPHFLLSCLAFHPCSDPKNVFLFLSTSSRYTECISYILLIFFPSHPILTHSSFFAHLLILFHSSFNIAARYIILSFFLLFPLPYSLCLKKKNPYYEWGGGEWKWDAERREMKEK